MYTERYTESSADAHGPRTRSAVAYDVIKRRLLSGDFALGSRLAEAALAESIGVSRTPVRDALSRLHAEGLAVRLAEGGYSPAAPDLHSVAELYEIRRHLEFGALRRGSHDLDQLRELAAHWGDMDAPADDADTSPDFVLHDEEFHLRLAAAAGNATLVTHLRGVNERIRSVRMHDFTTADRVSRTIEEHCAVVAALLDGDTPAADTRLASHLEISERVVAERAALALSRMLQTGTR